MKKISLKNLENWKNQKNTKKLLYALKVGTWDTRIKASEFLSEFDDYAIKQSLLLGLLDSIPKVVENLKIALQNFDLSNEEKEKIDLIIKSKYDKEKTKLLNELIKISKIKENEQPFKEKTTKAKKKIEESKFSKETKKENIKEQQIEIKKNINVDKKEEKEWFYRKRKEQIGPLKFDEIKSLIKSGQLKFTDYVWATGLKEWVRINNIEGFTNDIVVEEIPPPFFENENNRFELLNVTKRRTKQNAENLIVRIKDEINKPIFKKIITIGLPIVTISLVFLFVLFYKIKFEDGTTSTCYSCLGSGTVGEKCSVCSGKGKVTKTFTCSVCKGRGMVRCNATRTAYRESKLFGLISAAEESYHCKGGRWKVDGSYDLFDISGTICDYCNGTGFVDCSTCNGFGKVNKSITCSYCNNGITNIKDCDICNKTGIISNYKMLTVYEKYILPLFQQDQRTRQKVVKIPRVPGKYPQASIRLLKPSDLKSLSKSELSIMRNEIFARHGHIFNSGKFGTYFKKQKWYKGTVKNAGSLLSDIEKKNIQLILKYE